MFSLHTVRIHLQNVFNSINFSLPDKAFFNLSIAFYQTLTRQDFSPNISWIINMNFVKNAEEILIFVLEKLGLAWWVEIITHNPNCTYYFGPFLTSKNADFSQFGYIEDITQEGAKISSVEIKQYQPKLLTIIED